MAKRNRLTVFYSEKLNAPDLNEQSPSAGKPKLVVQNWSNADLDISIYPPEPVTTADLEKVHSPKFVRDVLACERKNGYGNRDPQTAASLPYVSGAMYDAAKYAYENNTIAVAPVVGFHHAEWDKATMFCTFNGFVVAAVKMLEEFDLNRVGILDCDHHKGNGTNSLIEKFKLHDKIHHYSAGYDYGWKSDRGKFFETLPSTLETFRGIDLVIYKAGADPHVDDPKGGWLTTEDLKMRDEIVFDFFGKNKIPVAWDLGGGYGKMEEVLKIHRNTAIAATNALHYYSDNGEA
ncbi:MAG: hypothetical protein R3C28_28670 [Pirellulaceae bacterium]